MSIDTVPVPLAEVLGAKGDPAIRACATVDRHAFAYRFPGLGLTVSEAISLNGKTWPVGTAIGVGFLDGSAAQRAKVRRWAARWTEIAKLSFDFESPDPALRVSFAQAGSWSLIGTDCLSVPSGPTINFGWVTDSSDDASDRAVIVHEFGHALGLGHEQSSPLNDIKWDRPKALAYFERTQGWSEQMVEDNVFSTFDPAQVTGTAYDRASIMQYAVDPSLTLDGRGIGWNDDLSPLDIAYIALLYPGHGLPGPTAPPPSPPPTAPPHPALPLVVVGRPAVGLPFPRAGQPAEFGLDLAADRSLTLRVSVSGGFGRDPAVEVIAPGGQLLALGLPRGVGSFKFTAGFYTLRVHHPFPRLPGMAWVRALPA